MRLRCLLLTLPALASLALADEGMWLFTAPPQAVLQRRYQFEPAREWLDHLQRSSVRFSNGSGSFVSAEGLVMTNHHVATGCIQKISTKAKDYVTTGFHAATRAQEIPCPDEELNVLISIEDVTARVKGAVKPGMSASEAQNARRGVINTIEKESLDNTGLRSEVVTLFRGGQYHLYRFKRYTDVRLVFAPERDIAAFGGDPDNFEFPRYDLDITFFRAYENGAPAKIEHYLKWSATGAKEGELTFVTGHPGRTDRLDTVTHLEFLRDTVQPYLLNQTRRREVNLTTYRDRSIENARQAQSELAGQQNSRKVRLGQLAGLQDPAVMGQKRAEEQALRAAVLKSGKLRESYGGAWNQVDAAIAAWRPIFFRHHLIETGAAFDSKLFSFARKLVRLAEESRKPNAERLSDFSESALDSLKRGLFSAAPIYPDLEVAKLADSLSMALETLGADDALLQKVMAGKSPANRAAELMGGSGLRDVAVRRKLAEGGSSAIEKSADPMIRLARLVDAPARTFRREYEERVEEPLKQAYAKLAEARFATYGADVYPDATFTLRLAFGQVKGVGKIPWATTLGDTFRHAEAHGNKDPFTLPKSWTTARPRLRAGTPFNFISTADIIGGNSGSPVVNRGGELVGIVFDGNAQSLVWDYVFTEEQGRAVSVHSAGILEALRSVYGANALVAELQR